jgi:hypothetical protein
VMKIFNSKLKCFTITFLAANIFFIFGCAPLTKNEEAQYAKLLNEGVVAEPLSKKSRWAAGTLDFIIPGVGHYYLGEWGTGTGLFLSNIFWPLSPFLATPTAVVATENINKRHTVEYFTLGEGKDIVAKKDMEKCYKIANDYIAVQKQNGKNDFTKNEIVQFLFMQNCTSDNVKGIDWNILETKTGSSHKQI